AVMGVCPAGRRWLAVLDPQARQVLAFTPDPAGQWTALGRVDLDGLPTGLSVQHHRDAGRSWDDLLVSASSGDVLRLTSNDDPTFGPCRNVMGGVALAVQDLGQGGSPEFVFADQGQDQVAVNLAGQTTMIGDAGAGMQTPTAVRLADLNNDQSADLII